jgi:hypothetical protein
VHGKVDALLPGPLARTVLGQGIDYAYTLQGWLKDVNSDSLLDEDGQTGSLIANDVYRFSRPRTLQLPDVLLDSLVALFLI